MATVEHLITAEELLHTPNLGRCELILGELFKMAPAGSEHGGIMGNLTIPIGNFVKSRKFGRIFGAETGFVIHRNPDTVRAPDIAFVRAERLAERLPKGFFEGAPDLAVEVLSPDDRTGYVQAKIRAWFDAGCIAVWIVDPSNETVTIHANGREAVVFQKDETLTDDQVLPGFSVAVSEIFE